MTSLLADLTTTCMRAHLAELLFAARRCRDRFATTSPQQLSGLRTASNDVPAFISGSHAGGDDFATAFLNDANLAAISGQ
jgi:hypothetical protein